MSKILEVSHEDNSQAASIVDMNQAEFKYDSNKITKKSAN